MFLIRMSLTGVVANIETIEPGVSIVKVQITTSKVIQVFFSSRHKTVLHSLFMTDHRILT